MANITIPKNSRITKKDLRVLNELLHLLSKTEPTELDRAIGKLTKIAEMCGAVPYKSARKRRYHQRGRAKR